MKKLVLIAHKDKKDRILKALHKSKLVEVCATHEVEGTALSVDSGEREDISTKLQRLSFAFSFLKAEKKQALKLVKDTKDDAEPFGYVPFKRPPFSQVQRIDFESFNDIVDSEIELFAAVAELEKISARYLEIRSEELKLTNTIEQMKLYVPTGSRFSTFREGKYTTAVLGVVPVERLNDLKQNWLDQSYCHFEFFEAVGKVAPVALVVLNTALDEVLHFLAEYDFSRCTYDADVTAYERIKECEDRQSELTSEKRLLLEHSLTNENLVPQLERLYDFYLVERAKSAVDNGLRCTKSTFILEAWYPASEQSVLEGILSDVCEDGIFEFRDPIEGEIQPTLAKNGSVVSPYQSVTNMYSVPLKGADIDPNPFVAFFYFLFFGMMLGDAAYGLILAVGGFALYALMRPTPGKGKLVLIIAMGGVSTFIWGVLFGTWFSIDLPADSFLRKVMLFNPLEEPLLMLILCYALGLVHIVSGMMVNAYQLIKAKKVAQAFGSSFSWLFLFVGIGLVAVNLFLDNVPKAVGIVAYVFLGAGLGCLILLSSSAKNPIKRIFGGIAKLYDGVNIFSDILSYSRLFGLGLATAVVGMVINKIAMVLVDLLTFGSFSAIGWIVGSVVLIGGHIFNIGINVLGTYVHDCRLQYIEFFGKFYTGGGHQFVPLGSNLKYTYIESGEAKKK